MAGPKVEVRTAETPQSAGLSQSTGTAFVAAAASYGPEVPTLVRSLGEAVAQFGPRTEAASTELYDWLNTFFSLGGSKAYVNRALGAGIKVGELAVESAAKKALIVESKYKGVYANKIKVEVLANGALEILNPESEVLESSGAATKASEVFEYFKGKEAYVIVKEGTEYAAAKGEQLKVLAAKALAGGVNPTVTEATVKTAIEGFPKASGPGQIAVAEKTNGVKEAVHIAMAEAAQKGNRIALCDLKEAAVASTSVATLTAEKGTYTTELSKYMLFTASACIVQGVTLGTTRTVPGSAAVAGLCARVSQTGNDNQAAAGEDWPLGPFVTGFTNPYKQTEIEELSTAGINAFKEVVGIPCLFGFVTACSKEKDLIFWQASASRERMALVFAAELIGNGYLFKTIDGRKRLIARFQGDLQGVVKKHWEANALFGETAPEAGLVQCGEPVNTLTTIANGELNAELIVRISPYANVVSILIVSTPVTEAV
jgi:hypothetical protein